MDDQNEEMEKPFAVERAKTGRAKCKKCKCPIEKETVRIAKLMSNPFGDGKMKAWHHVTCLFDVFAKQRATTKRIEDPSEDVSGWDDLRDEDKRIVLEKIEEFENNAPFKNAANKKTPKKNAKAADPTNAGPPAKLAKRSPNDSASSSGKPNMPNGRKENDKKIVSSSTKDDSFREFRRLCAEIANASAYTEKTAIIKRMLTKGSEGDGFKSNIILWCELLLPGAVKRIYNLQSKQLIKLFARLFRQNEDEMLEDLEQGDVAETIRIFFEKSTAVKPNTKSLLTVQEVDKFLAELTQLTREDDQEQHFRSIIDRCTPNDLKMLVRLIKRDLRINAGPKHILEAVHSDAYRAYQVSNDLGAVIERCLGVKGSPSTSTKNSKKNSDASNVTLSLMTPVLPMLAEACKSIEMAMKKCPNGMLSEVKYDGERVQVHKKGAEFRYFSRSLKPVLPHKIKLFKDFLPEAFPDGDDLILDSEILMIDTTTGQPLPFGSLGKHKKEEFKDANVCLFVFDCMYYNGDVLMDKPMKERRKILKDRMTIIPNRIMLSEVQEVHDPKDLAEMIAKVLKMGLEGLVLKDMNSLYEPGKRHWLKVKKDYLFDGAMADSADLVVLGAWYGTGQKGGMMSVFLMGCYDDATDQWVTVTKVHTGHDDATLTRLQDELDMVKIGKDHNLVPNWLKVNRPMVPDFVARDPKKQPVWEITGAEFTNQGVHTADSISIRFPRVTKIRDDKCWQTATRLTELRVLFQTSSASIDFSLLLGTKIDDEKKPTMLDDYLKAGTSRVSTSPSISPSKKIKNERVSDDEEAINDRARSKKKGKRKKIESDDESFNSEESAECNGNIKRVSRSSESKAMVKTVANLKPSTSRVSTSPLVSPLTKIKNERISDEEEQINNRARIKKKGKRKKIESDDESSKSEESAEYNGNIATLSRSRESNAHGNGIFAGVRVSLSHDFDKSKRQALKKTLKIHGAKILREKEISEATHVIHDTCEVPATILHEYPEIPKKARHVNYSWVEESAAESRMLDVLPHVVKLHGVYCECPCPHRR